MPRALQSLSTGATLADAVDALQLLDRSSLGTVAVAERTGTLGEALEKLSQQLHESSLRSTRVLLMLLIAAFAAVLLVAIVGGMLGSLFGPVKKLYDAAGTGNLDGL